MVEAKIEISMSTPATKIARWLDQVDQLGSQIPLQVLTQKSFKHPLESKGQNFGTRQENIQLGLIIENILANRGYFSEERTESLLNSLNTNTNQADAISPQTAVDKLIEKQRGYLEKGESWQFVKVGLEVNPIAQRVAYKLHALQELLEPYAGEGARKYEDQLADIFTEEILGNADKFRFLSRLLGPFPASVRWNDFLSGQGNINIFKWIEALQQTGNRDEYADILLVINAFQSKSTPETTIQVLERKTFRSTGKVPPLKSEDVADPHLHKNKVELYLPLLGPGMLKVKFTGETKVHSFTPSPNLTTSFELASLGAYSDNGEPVLVYRGKEYRREGRFINVPIEDNQILQWIVVMPGDIHDYQNVGISPASAYALTLGFPKEEGLSLNNDFYPKKL